MSAAAVTAAALPLTTELSGANGGSSSGGNSSTTSEKENVSSTFLGNAGVGSVGIGGIGVVGGAGAIQKSSTICRYYLRGICRFGNLCRFSHDAIGGEILSTSNDGSSNIGIEGSDGDGDEDGDGGGGCSTSNITTKASTSSAAAAAAAAAVAVKTLLTTDKRLTNWANAPAFVPSGKIFNFDEHNIDVDDLNAVDVEAAEIDANVNAATTTASNKTWAEVVGGGGDSATTATTANYVQFSAPASVDILCPYESPCPYGDYCAYTMHLELCKMCDMYVLHPNDLEQRRKHNQECLLQHEKDMELSFAIARSRDKTCGICMDIIMEKSGREKRFGILPNCTHIFCLECIRKWRQAKQFEHKITRSCPECRIASDFVCPSAFWVETKEEKEKLLSDYRAALGVKDCKYFKKGSGKCPFGNKCFYKHALANGELVDVGCPRRSRKLLHQTNELIDLLDIYLWEFVDHRDYNFLDLLSNTSDLSDDSDFDA